MLASVQKHDGGYFVRYDRPLNHSVEKVWAAMTENDKLAKWMPNLQVEDLREGGTIRFDMQDGTDACIPMEILDYQLHSVLAFKWGEDRVRFELYPKHEGCLLVLKEFVGTLTAHSPKDFAGWHVCLDRMSALLEGQDTEFSKSDWEHWYIQYAAAVNSLR